MVFVLHFYSHLEAFPRVFLCDLFFKLFVFSHLSYISILSIRILFYEENWFVIFEITKCCNLLLFVGILLCKGDYGGCVWLYWYPSKYRGDCSWSVGFEPYPSIERLILFYLSAHPSKCRGDCCCALPLV